ncbi:GILT-like protein 1 [Cardiocondyla obscurior]
MKHYLACRATLAAAVFIALVSRSTLSNAQSSGESNKNEVNVDVYYESLCSDSMRFIANQLVPSYPELEPYVKINFIPYGKAMHSFDSETGLWQFVCQHGPAECRGNKAQACAIRSIEVAETNKNKQSLAVNLVGCVMSAENPANAVPQCAQSVGLSEEAQAFIDNCITTSMADELLSSYGNMTYALQSPLRFVPTIVINKEYSKENQDEALRNFSKLICRHLTAEEKPSVCSKN